MIILGVNGGPDFIDDNWVEGPIGNHDSSAVLLRDGRLVAAVEEERLNRFKHTNKAPLASIAFCLEHAGLTLDEVDVIAIPQSESELSSTLLAQYQTDPAWRERFGFVLGRRYVVERLESRFGATVHPNKVYFTHHHVGHAASAYHVSGFDSALVATLDGYGNALSGLLAVGRGSRLDPLAVIPGSPVHGPAELMEAKGFFSDSLGLLYLAVTEFLGFRLFDEYKVMGLAPYGDPAVLRDLFREAYALLPEGRYRIRWDRLKRIRAVVPPPRERVFEAIHKDAAAALQEALTAIVMHLLGHWREVTGLENLCLAGGVGLNCTLNGVLLRSGLWRGVFVQPAAGDGGLALGAALDAYHSLQPQARPVRLEHVYLGPECGSSTEIAAELASWSDFLEFEAVGDVGERTAAALADGDIVGWVQGRMEFGPRALGNRSILADPRPASNVARINEMVKKREAFRPFAPAVLEEHVAEWFELPGNAVLLDYMLASVPVRRECRGVLGATTHVDGSARLQRVKRGTNPRFWALVRAFHERTGVPALLNTSFNNNHEPIVNTPFDAVVCFLTTELTLLVIGDHVARKRRPLSNTDLLPLTLRLAAHTRLRYLVGGGARDAAPMPFSLSSTCGGAPLALSAPMFSVLSQADGVLPLEALLARANVAGDGITAVLDETRRLWDRRALVLRPVGRDGVPPRRTSPTEPVIRELLAEELRRSTPQTVEQP